ncbi:MAG: flagellin FliC [Deltaproteobacteria bacterium]|nr:flagellin FliC [Deltaproteobacteria bacterium]
MGFRIATNVQSLSSQRTLNTNREGQNRSLEKLAAGERITRASDDAAGLAISEKLKAEIRSLRQANRNANDGISLIQTAEGGANEIQNILIRLRELSMQSATDTVGDVERGFTDKEVQNLVSEVQRISQVTSFNGKNLLNGTGGALEFQVGTHNKPAEDRMIYDTTAADATAEKLGIAGMTVAKKEDAQGNLAKLDEAIRVLNDNRAGFGALQNRLQSTINNLNVADENLSAANSRIRDVDIASESSELTKKNILMQAGTAMLAQANSNGMMALKLIA